MTTHLGKALFAASLMASPLLAQMRGGLPVLAPSSPSASVSRGFPGHFARRGSGGRSLILGTPYWGDEGYAQEQPLYVIQPPVAESPHRVIDERTPEAPLLIELQGDQYIRRTGDNHTAHNGAEVAKAIPSRSTVADNRPAEILPTLFVFRDGHREESSDYSIVSGVIYSRGDYWTSGSWSKKILIPDLDVAATLRANQERGVPFRFPSAPNEVITRP
jgi:hypothetical protein